MHVFIRTRRKKEESQITVSSIYMKAELIIIEHDALYGNNLLLVQSFNAWTYTIRLSIYRVNTTTLPIHKVAREKCMFPFFFIKLIGRVDLGIISKFINHISPFFVIGHDIVIMMHLKCISY